MSVTVIVGCQWGDEGKGKIVDVLAAESHIVARYQGGSNAGHTVVLGAKKHVFHMMPSGILHGGVLNILGSGVVIDLASLNKEIGELDRDGIDAKGRLLVSEQAHLILPYHKALDAAAEGSRAEKKIGTTQRGIGLCYADKMRRFGLRMGELRHRDHFVRRYREVAQFHSDVLHALYRVTPPPIEATLEELLNLAAPIIPLIADTVTVINDALDAGKSVLAEGAQGVLLDIDHGTYPFVTSSSPTAGGACTGLGIAPTRITRSIGIVKAYTTRVGSGPMPTELAGEEGDKLRGAGGEFGATTGRPRRCGWMDVPVVRRALQIAGCTEIVITKLDVLDGYEEVPVCTHYLKADGKPTHLMPFDIFETERVVPQYETHTGWNSSTTAARKMSDLPDEAINYLRRLENLFGARISFVSTGPDRDATMKFDSGR